MKILMATGGSAHSEQALKFGVHLLTAIDTERISTILTVIKYETDRLRAEEIIQHACTLVEPISEQIITKIRLGHPAEEILKETEEDNYSLVIIGEKQHHGLVTRFLLGSTAQRVVEHAPCPVVVAKGKIGPVKKILLCDSGIESPTLLGRFIQQSPRLIRGQEEITVLHVMSQMSAGPGVPGKQLRADAEELIFEHAPEGNLLKQDVQALARLSVNPIPKVRHGLVVDEIIAEAGDGDYDLVVIGAHRGEGWRRILLDDLAHQILAKLDRPVLVVR